MKTGSRNIAILFFTLIVVMLGFGMIIPIMPFYIQSLGASGSALGALMATYGVLQLLFAPFWGGLSDRVGRKPVLLVGVFGNALAQLLFGLSTQLWMLFAARALAGILSSATLPTAMAYIGDSTTKEDRGGGMGVIGAAMGIGMVIGPGLGGWLADRSLSFPFFLASGLSLLAFILISLVLPEAPRSQTAPTRRLGGPQLGTLRNALAGPSGILFLMAFLLTFGLTNFEGVFGLYSADRLGYGPSLVGLLLMLVGITSAIVQGALTGPFTRRFGEVPIIRGAFFFTAVGFVLMLQARSLPLVALTVFFFVLSHAMLNPAVASLISKRADSSQGIAMGLNNSFQSLGRVVGPLWAGFAFDINMSLPYLSGAVILLVGFLVSLIWLSARWQPSIEPAAIQVTD